MKKNIILIVVAVIISLVAVGTYVELSGTTITTEDIYTQSSTDIIVDNNSEPIFSTEQLPSMNFSNKNYSLQFNDTIKFDERSVYNWSYVNLSPDIDNYTVVMWNRNSSVNEMYISYESGYIGGGGGPGKWCWSATNTTQYIVVVGGGGGGGAGGWVYMNHMNNSDTVRLNHWNIDPEAFNESLSNGRF